MSRQCCHKLEIGEITFYCVERAGHQCPHAYTVIMGDYQRLHERTEKAERDLAAAKALIREIMEVVPRSWLDPATVAAIDAAIAGSKT